MGWLGKKRAFQVFIVFSLSLSLVSGNIFHVLCYTWPGRLAGHLAGSRRAG